MTREHLDVLAEEVRDAACHLEQIAELAACLGEAPDQLHRSDSDPSDRLREAAVVLRSWAMRLSSTSTESETGRMIAADQLDQPQRLADYLETVCDRLDAYWDHWEAGDVACEGVQWCAGIEALGTARAFAADLGGAYDYEWAAAVCGLLKQAFEGIQNSSGEPSSAEDFATGVAQAREAAAQLRAMATAQAH